MPLDSNGNVADTVTITGADATKNSDGTYTAIARFASIPFRYEGTYYYKITELDTGIDGVQYDLDKVYYLKIEVSKKYTTFPKTYTYDHMTHPAKYTSDTTLNEDFFYLGADVVYSDKEDFSNVLATCELKLGSNPDTAKPENNEFIVEYKNGTSVYNTSFNNTLKGNLTVRKEWKGSDGSDEKEKHEQALTITILQKPEKGTSTWNVYGTVQLTRENNWSQTVTDLPIYNDKGVKYQYCVKESDDFLATFEVVYTYNGKSYQANGQTKQITVDGGKAVDPGFKMKVGSDGKSYGEVTITNRSLVVNTLPAAGGMGTLPFTIAGVLIAVSALVIMIIYRKKHLV